MSRPQRVFLILGVYSSAMIFNGLPSRFPFGILIAVILALVIPTKQGRHRA